MRNNRKAEKGSGSGEGAVCTLDGGCGDETHCQSTPSAREKRMGPMNKSKDEGMETRDENGQHMSEQKTKDVKSMKK